MNKRKITVIIAVSVLSLVLLVTDVIAFLNLSKRSSFDRFFDIVSDSSPTVYSCDISYKLKDVTLRGKYELSIADIDGEKCARLTYEYDKLNEIGEADRFKSRLGGTLYAKGDSEVGEMKDSAIIWETGTVPADITPLNLTKEMFDSFEIDEKDGGIITFTGKLAKDALEKDIKDAFVYIECEKEAKRITQLIIKYTDKGGASVSAEYVYSYDKQSFEIK